MSFLEGVLEDTLSPLIQSVHDTPLQENKMRPKGHVAHLQLNNKCQRWFKQPSFSLFCIFAYIICIFFYKIETALYNPTSTLNSLLYMFYNNYLIKKTSIWNILRHFQSKIYLKNIHSLSSTGPASSELKQHHKLINANNPLIMEK